MKPNTRRLISLLCAASAALSLLAAGAVLTQRQVRLRGALNGLPDPALEERPPVLGVNVALEQYDPAALDENLGLLEETGFRWLRQSFAWATAEPEAGVYEWAAFDAIVEAADAHGFALMAVLEGSPGWAADTPTAPPADPDAFAGYAGAFAERYGDRINVYQIWDEPNLSSGWGGQPPNPVAYAALLEAAYGVIHAADADALVLAAGLAPTTETGPENVSDLLYLEALYANGAAPFFDGAAGKPYGFDSGPDDRRAYPNLLNFSRFVQMREIMEANGDENKPLWASHFGWNALPEGWTGGGSVWGQTSPEQQAVWTTAAYERALLEWPWAGALILENWQPDAASDDPRWGFALRAQDGTLSPTAEAIRAQAALFNSALWPGIYPAQTALADYGGAWEFSELGADIVENGSSTVSVPFAGDTLAVRVRRDHYRAYLYVTVDGEPPGILPRDERGAYLVLTSPDYQPRLETVLIAEGLAAGESHLATIEAERGWDQWALAGFAVGNRVRTAGYNAALAALLALAAGLVAGALWAGHGAAWQEAAGRAASWLATKPGEALHLALALAASLAVWTGAALTWGGAIPDALRRLGDGPSLLITALTAGVFYFSPWLVLTLAALIALFVLIYARPSTGLALMMFFTPYYLLPRPLFDRAFSMVEATTLLTLAAWSIHIIAGRKEKGWPTLPELWRRMTGLDKAAGLFVLVCIISLIWADLRGVAVTELRQMVIEPFTMYLALRTLPTSEGERWRIVDLLVLTGVIVSLIGFYQFATGIDIITAEAGAQRLKSVFGTPNNAALFLERIIPIGGALALIGRGNARRRWLYGIAGALMLGAAGLTLSKGAILLGIPAGLALVVILWAGRRGVIAVAAGAAVEIAALIPLSRLPRFSGLIDFSSGTSSSFFRLQLWQSTLRMIRDHPITGVGLDQFLYQYRGRYILPDAWQQPDLSQPHNFLLNYWVRLGIVGLAAGVWMQAAFWRMAWGLQARLKGRDADQRALVVGLMGGMAAFLAHGMVDAVHFVIDLAFIFYMSLGLVAVMNEKQPGKSRE
jgi:O-antigen ligase